MTSSGAAAKDAGSRRGRVPARLSWWMLAVFAVWTLGAIFLTEPVLQLLFGFAPTRPGETFYLEAWGPWLAVTFVWLAPVIAGVVFAAVALRRGAGKLTWLPLAIHAVLFVSLTVPNIVERLLTL